MSRKSKLAEKFAEDSQDYNISITGRHVHVTDGMKNYATEKVGKIERFSDRIIDVLVTMDIQKLDHKVDIVIKVDHTKIKAQASTKDMYASIDMAVGKIENQLLKYKNKLQDHHAKGLAAVDMNVNVFSRKVDPVEEMNEEIEAENRRVVEAEYKPHEIVNSETRPLKILTYEEAIMKMELSKDHFMIFRNEEDNKIKVIYIREDGNFGIIEPE
ncbi:MAG: putative sigma-54 modulation protein [Chlamydiales bacterium]|jgi:putative sigma-54 modulation protein